jgi:uncharacterized membrane protein
MKIRVNRRVDVIVPLKCYICKLELSQLDYNSHLVQCKTVNNISTIEPDLYKYHKERITNGELTKDEVLAYNSKIDCGGKYKHNRRASDVCVVSSGVVVEKEPSKDEMKRKQRKKSMDDMRTFDMKQIRSNITNRYFI